MENTSGNVGSPLATLASREKYWNELTSDEKIERLRLEVKRLQTEKEDMTGKLERARVIAEYHQHNEHGFVVMAPDHVKEGEYRRKKITDKGGDEVYI